MATEQGTLFDQRKYRGVKPQSYQIEAPLPDQTVTAMLPAYYAYLSSGQYSKYTPDDFSSDIKRLGLYVGSKALKDIQAVDIQRWIGQLKKTMTAKTVSRKIASIGNYFHWLEQEKALEHNPANTIRAPRVTSPLPDILLDSECEQLLCSVSNDPRTYLLILLLLETGLKSTELMDLKITHFDFSNKYQPELWVKHTGSQVRKDRKLKLPPQIFPVFEDYAAAPLRRHPCCRTAEKSDRWHPEGYVCCPKPAPGMPIEDVLKKIGLSDRTWDDAKNKYERLASVGM